ncbi:hypothetical protein ABQJ54_09950 [Rhodanobacter sp. Si-c]|uniref:Chemotaxis methyl-accepting receptor HlyB-like 4HB MCP domain-containing protein n=1 Tax=Rhodanobacter lycopersici TaxID=3162487 RepID=A0ABV3QE17_9GAMM
MHIEPPTTRLASFRDFAKHYLMIVLSILTALGLEAWIEHAHHTHAAAIASMQIERELRDNLADIRASLVDNRKDIAVLEQLEHDVAQAIRNGQSDSDINAYIQAHRERFKLSIDWPHLPSQAWDVAVANQSAGWIDATALRRYSNAYAGQRAADAWLTSDSTIMLDAPRMSVLSTRLNLGKAVDPTDFLGVLDQMIHTAQETQSHLEQLEPQISAALPAADRSPGPPGS